MTRQHPSAASDHALAARRVTDDASRDQAGAALAVGPTPPVPGPSQSLAPRSGMGAKRGGRHGKHARPEHDTDGTQPAGLAGHDDDQAGPAQGSGPAATVSDAAPGAGQPAPAAGAGDPAGAGDSAGLPGGASAGGAGSERGHGAGHVLPYALGGLAVIGGGLALSGGGGGSSAAPPPKVPESVDSPTLALVADTGSSASDGITKSGSIAVSNLQTGAKWDYSTDGGATWTAGTGSSFTVAAGSYAAGAIQARQTSTGGTTSSAGKLAAAVTIDTTTTDPVINAVTANGDNVLSLAEANAAEGVTVAGTAEANAQVTITWRPIKAAAGASDVATATVQANAKGEWQYTFKAGALPDAAIAQSTLISVYATDPAGNSSQVVTRVVATDPGLTVSGTITAGAVIAGNDLTVTLYAADGRVLASGVPVNADGTYRIANLPVHAGDVVIATLGNGPAADFADEASGNALNLTAALLGVAIATANGVTLAVNPLTTAVARASGLAADAAGALTGQTTAAAVAKAGQAVAQALGLGGADLASLTPVVMPAGGYPADATLGAAQKAGVLLAALSGLDGQNGGVMQTGLDTLVAGLAPAGTAGSLSEAALVALVAGAQAASVRFGPALVSLLASQLASASAGAGVTIAAIAGDDIVTAAERAGLTLAGTVAEGASGVTLQFGQPGAVRTVQATVAGTGWSYQLTADDLVALAADGGMTVRAEAKLADGGTATAARAALVAQSAPTQPAVAPVLGADLLGSEAAAGSVTVSGTGQAGTRVVVTWGTAAAHAAVVAADGTWSTVFDPGELPRAEGASRLAVQAFDRFGNASAVQQHTVTVDFTPPQAPVIGAVGTNFTISPQGAAAGVPVSGTAEVGARVFVRWQDGTWKAATVDASGAWQASFAAGELPADGTRVFEAYQIDAAGNRGPVAQLHALVAQQATGVQVAPIAGGDGVNRAEAEAGVTVAGVAAPGTTLVLDWAGAGAKRVTADALGYWKVVYQFGEMPADGGARPLVVRGTDAGAPVLATVQTVIDTQPPMSPTVNKVAGDNVVNAVEKAANVEVSGTGELGATVAVTWGKVTHTQVLTTTSWSVTFTADEVPADTGATPSTVSVRLTDAVGNVSLATTVPVTVKATLPATPGLTLRQDTGASTSDGITSNRAVDVSGLVAGAKWEYTFNGETWLKGTGTSFNLVDGSYAAGVVRVRQTDDAGNVSAEGSIAGAVAIRVQKPVLLVDLVTEDNKVNAAEKAGEITVRGSIANWDPAIPVDVTVKWFDGTGTGEGITGRKITVGEDGTWSTVFASGEIPNGLNGQSTLLVSARDVAGNETQLQPRLVAIKATAPVPPVMSLERDTGASATDGVTSNGTLLITSVLAGQRWEYSLDGGATWQDGGFGNGRLTLEEGSYPANSILVRQYDDAGNVSRAAQYATALVIDSQAIAPTIDPIGASGVINAALKAGNVTITGHAEPGSAVKLTWNGNIFTATADAADGRWSVTVPSAQIPGDGTSTLSVVATDLAGNATAAPGVSATVTVNTARPGAPDIDPVAGNNVISAAEKAADVKITGHTAIGTTVKVTFGGVEKDATVKADGTWEAVYRASEVPADATAVPVTAVATNAAGNASLPLASPRLVEIDTRADAPTILAPVPDAQTGAAIVNAAAKARGLDVSGTAEAGAIVEVTLAGTTVSATAGANGAWRAHFEIWQLPGEGAATLTARAIDVKGNTSDLVSQGLRFDTVAPAGAVIDAIAGDNIVTVAEAQQPVVVSGSAEAGAKVAVNWGTTVQTVTANADGIWQAQFTAAPGTAPADVVVKAVATDAAGNAGPVTTRSVLVLGAGDPGLTIAPVAGDDRINIAEKANGVRLIGTGTPNSSVDLTWGGKTIAVTVGTNGFWTQSFASNELPADALTTLTVSAAGQSYSRTVLIDTVRPGNPVLTDVSGSTPGALGDRLLTAAEKATGSVLLSGTGEAGATVQVSWGGVSKTALVDATNHWSATFASSEVPGDGATSVRLVTVDAAGNSSSGTDVAVSVNTALTALTTGSTVTGIGFGDTLLGEAGNDTLVIPDLGFRRIDGGAGSDTLSFGQALRDATLDLTQLAAGKLLNIETIDLTGGGSGNHLVVDAASILADTGGANKLIVTGTADERVTAFGFARTGTAQVTENGQLHTYTVYTSGSATLWVDQTIQHVVL